MTDLAPTRPVLPTFALDYAAGTFTNTLTGETSHQVTGVVLGQREGRALWPSSHTPDPRPECVNGSKYGPCDECLFATWSPSGEPPVCSEELTLLLWAPEDFQIVELTARRTQVQVVERWLNMKALLSGTLHDQEVSIRMTPEGNLCRLTLLPGRMLDAAEAQRLEVIVQRVQATGAFGGL